MGTGIQDIVEKCVDYGLPEPEFAMRDGFVVTIYRKNGLAYEKINDESGAIGGAIGGAMLTGRQIEIIDILKNTPTISYRNLALQLNINESAVLKHLDNLKKNEIIERIGGTRGYWKILI
jgi:ATP-dependent DNA helicase RecG